MNAVSRFFRKLSILFTRKRYRSELDEEMAFHRSEAEKALVADGVKPDIARTAAKRQFGNGHASARRVTRRLDFGLRRSCRICASRCGS